MPKVKMKQNALGCEDGIHAKEYVAGECYELSESLAKDFLSLNACELVEANQEPEQKSEASAPKNKAHKSAPKNKSELGE